jgi:hypothetical protein
MKILNILEDIEMDSDPCFQKNIQFYQSTNGRELLEIMRKHIENQSIDPRYKMDKTTKKRLRFLMTLVPKC